MAPYFSPPFWEWLAIHFHYGVILNIFSKIFFGVDMFGDEQGFNKMPSSGPEAASKRLEFSEYWGGALGGFSRVDD